MIVAVEELNGLPGEGPPPKHFHAGSPTPWREGHVVRFFTDDGPSWVGNFQEGQSYYNAATLWGEANLVVVVASGACYLVSAPYPDRYTCRQTCATGILFDEHRRYLFVADYTDLYAYDRTGGVVWKRELLGIDGIELMSCASDIIAGRACSNPPAEWCDFRIRALDGTDA